MFSQPAYPNKLWRPAVLVSVDAKENRKMKKAPLSF